MKKIILSSMLVAFLLSSGCYTTGLSVRENRSANYSSYLYGLYDEQFTEGEIKISDGSKAKLELPITLAVAQVGEYTPPQQLIESLKQKSDLFSEVKGIPAVVDASLNKEAQGDEVKKQIQKMRRFAADLGVRYLFLYGGSIDFIDKSGAATIVDLTIVGAYIIPTHEIKAVGKSSGALIDVEKGNVVFLVDTEVSSKDYASTAQSNSKQEEVIENMRCALTENLAKNLCDKLSN